MKTLASPSFVFLLPLFIARVEANMFQTAVHRNEEPDAAEAPVKTEVTQRKPSFDSFRRNYLSN